jgi:hypothetical protein
MTEEPGAPEPQSADSAPDPDDYPTTSQSPEVDTSTEELAEQEHQEAHRGEREADRDAGRRQGEGEFHSRSQGDRED